MNKYVRAKFDDYKVEVCQIIKVQEIESKKSVENKDEFCYEYYMHFLSFDRRNDKWVSKGDIVDVKVTEEEAKKLIKEKEENNKFHNNENEGMDKAGIKLHEEATKIRNINEIVFGKYKISTWYFSPLPEKYHRKILYFCEFCLDFFINPNELSRICKSAKLGIRPETKSTETAI